MDFAASTITPRYRNRQTLPGNPLAQHVPLAESLGDEVGARASVDLCHRIAHMRAYRVVRDPQLLGDLWPSVAECDQSHDRLLALRQPLTPAPLPAASEVLASITTAADQAFSDLRIVKHVDRTTAHPGQRLTYTLTVTTMA
jgi:hypothetical protein